MKIDLGIKPKKEIKPKPSRPTLTNKQRKEVMKGWYIHCNSSFYVGYGWRTLPPCPKCNKKSEKATQGQVYDEHS